jgi:hypothetical protein
VELHFPLLKINLLGLTSTTWTTTVMLPQNAKGFYIMLSVETGKARLFANFAVDITGE